MIISHVSFYVLFQFPLKSFSDTISQIFTYPHSFGSITCSGLTLWTFQYPRKYWKPFLSKSFIRYYFINICTVFVDWWLEQWKNIRFSTSILPNIIKFLIHFYTTTHNKFHICYNPLLLLLKRHF